MKLSKRFYLIFLFIRKTKAKWHIEQDIAFLTNENNTIFDKTEEQLREELEQLRLKITKHKDSADKVKDEIVQAGELERQINKYDSIKATYGKSGDELKLITKYLAFLKGCITGKITYEMEMEKPKEEENVKEE
jgi:hypothetical protein